MGKKIRRPIEEKEGLKERKEIAVGKRKIHEMCSVCKGNVQS